MKTHSCVLNIATSFVYSLFLPFLFVTFVVCCAGKICVSAVHGYSNLTCFYGERTSVSTSRKVGPVVMNSSHFCLSLPSDG